MIRFGVIGTNTITEKLIEAGKQHSQFKLTGVYSRTKARAEEFASAQGAAYTFTNIDALADSEHIDAVYIASPNAFHAEQAIVLMRKGKHVLCEKPMASNQQEIASMIEVAKDEGVVLMEGIKSTLMPGFLSLQKNLHKIGRIRRYVGNFCKYSSRYDAYKAGKVLNAFNPSLSNGSLMDLGIYGVYPMVVLFGGPQSIKANGVFLESGVDGEGSLIASYEDMEAVIMHSKIINSHCPSEIQGEKGTMLISNISEPEDIHVIYTDGTVEKLTFEDEYQPMYYEVNEFIQVIVERKGQSTQNSYSHTLIAARIMEDARKQMGIVYPADQK